MFAKLFVITLIIGCSVGTREVDDACISPESVDGVCTLIYQCATAINSIQINGFHKLKRCGFRNLTEIVCCVEGKEGAVGDRLADATEESESGPRLPPLHSTTTYRPTPKRTSTHRHVPTKAPLPPSTPRPAMNASSFSVTAAKRKIEKVCDYIKANVGPPLDIHILGGVEAYAGEFPHMVAVAYKKEDDSTTSDFLCGGTLVTRRYVMSAGHCYSLRMRTPKFVRVGNSIAVKAYNPDTDYNIETITIHPDFTRRLIKNDIALLKLERAVPLSENVYPGCLYTKDEIPDANLIVTGYGVTEFGTKRFSDHLLKVALKLVVNSQCVKHYEDPRGQLINDKVFCAGEVNGGKDACQGDSGGPLQALIEKDGFYRVMGITSFGKDCGTSVPGVYTKVSAYLDWIEGIIWSNATAEDLEMIK